MSKNKKPMQLTNTLTELAGAVRVSSLLTGGSFLSDYSTIARANNYSLITLNRIILTYLFTGNGIFQTAIQLPVQDAVSGGIELIIPEFKPDQIEELLDWMETPFNDSAQTLFSQGNESLTPWEVVSNTYTWARLYGGGGMVINNGEDPEKPLEDKNIQNSFLELYDVDRWQLDFGTFLYRDDPVFSDWINRDYFFIHGVKFHKSRILRSRGKRAPYYVRRQLRGWGMSDGERMIRDLNLFLKTQDVLYEVLDESKVDVYKIKNFAKKLLQKGSTETIKNRVLLANQMKNYINALILDAEEEYQQKTMTFSGLAEVMRENRIGIAAALRMPMTKLFGLSASGFNTGEADLENYNKMLESEIRTPISPLIRTMIKIGCLYLYGRIPKFKFKFKKLRLITAQEEENMFTNQQTRALMAYDRGLLTPEEYGIMGEQQGWIPISTKAGRGELPEDLQLQRAKTMGEGGVKEGREPKEPESKKIEEEPWFKRRAKPR